jgi:hypothetical protein
MIATPEESTAPPPTTDEVAAPASAPGRRAVVRALAVMAVVGAALAVLIVGVAGQSDDPAVDPFEVTVAADTATGLRSGDIDDLVPKAIRLQPGQLLVLRNRDRQLHTLGDLTAEQGDTVRISYPTEGRHITATSLRADGRLTILVQDTTP